MYKIYHKIGLPLSQILDCQHIHKGSYGPLNVLDGLDVQIRLVFAELQTRSHLEWHLAIATYVTAGPCHL